MANVYVTGVAGFLGSHIANYHLDRGDHVWGVDNFSSSHFNSKHIKLLIADKRFSFAKFDVSETRACEYMRAQTPATKIDVVYNFACPASPPIYQRMPIETMMTCVVGTKNALDFAREHEAIVVHASTSEVYGDPETSPQFETYKGNVNSYGPRSCYDEGKRAAEALCFDYLHKNNVDARLVRIFNTYGPNMDQNDGRVISNFISQALRHEPLTIYGDGMQTRSFCYVDDLVRAIVAMADLSKNPGTPINIGNPDEFNMMQLADVVLEKMYGTSVRPRFTLSDPNMFVVMPLPKDDPTQRKPDITLAKEILKWEPKISLAEGVDKTFEYFRKVII